MPNNFFIPDQVTNQEAAKWPAMQKACDDVGIPVSARQASKYRRGKGMAYTGLTAKQAWGHGAAREVDKFEQPIGPCKAQVRPVCKRK